MKTGETVLGLKRYICETRCNYGKGPKRLKPAAEKRMPHWNKACMVQAVHTIVKKTTATRLSVSKYLLSVSKYFKYMYAVYGLGRG